ncbi:hypothetical protein AB1Y20_003346 [Prymnesium parvum]|uniref:Glutamine amidotransferase type-2 domain-containing protein n=1 Tax=Prymnesium parvum TaxID=97485 RepID=A0AB34JBL8_PRYPA
MCGIGVVLLTRGSSEEPSPPPSGSVPAEALRRRGPDAVHEATLHAAASDGFELRMTGAVLHLRGAELTPQPLRSAHGDALLWNGEVFGGLPAVSDGQSDTEQLLRALTAGGAGVGEVMAAVHGPWTFAFWDERTRSLWYGRDRLGRRSLLRAQLELRGGWRALVLSSVALERSELGGLALAAAEGVEWEELRADGLACARVGAGGRLSSAWLRSPPPPPPQGWGGRWGGWGGGEAQRAAAGLLGVLSESVRRRVRLVPRGGGGAAVGVLFSGGIDSMVLARLADAHLPPAEPLELINVAFGATPSAAPDRVGALAGARELAALSRRPLRLVCVDVSLAELRADRPRLTALLRPASTVMDLNIGAALWYGARGRGWRPRVAAGAPPPPPAADGCRYAGCMPFPTDPTPREASAGVELHLHFDEAGGAVRLRLRLGGAAGGGEEEALAVDEREYCSTAKVLLLGMGADEQLGGYGRHRTVYRQEGWEGLSRELHAERERLWLRNLGRDDRMVSDWGREARHPFLDEEVMAFIRRTPLPLLCNLDLGFGEGDKQILRRAARLLGLSYSSYLQKRAIQFGTRIANKNVCGMATLDESIDLADVVHPRAEASCTPRSTMQELHKKRKAWGTARAYAPLPVERNAASA